MKTDEATGELLVVPSVDCRSNGDTILLDKKFVAGMTMYQQLWQGPVRCLMRHNPDFAPAFAENFDRAALPFAITVIGTDAEFSDEDLCGAAIVLGGGDDTRQTGLAHQCKRLSIPCFYGVEYTLKTRLGIIAAENRGAWKRLKSTIWTFQDEYRRRRSFAAAQGLQANGIPAFHSYASRPHRDHMYLDTRLSIDAMAGPEELQRLETRLDRKEPLRLLFTGRLERMKGADHLVPLMQQLRARHIAATLDLYGSGSLWDEIAAAISDNNLQQSVRLNPPLDFETELVHRIKGAFDVFVCCHRQSDPSCTYIETLGCGIPIAGYGNKALAGLLDLADFGWTVPVGNVAALADVIANISTDRSIIAKKAAAGLDLARQNAFETVFQGRIAHLKGQLAQLTGDTPGALAC